MVSNLKDVTVYIGRFSPFHLGHSEVLKKALLESRLVIVLIGSVGQARSLKNPFTFDERKQMIGDWHSCMPNKSQLGNLVILPIRDYPYNDALWIRNVQKTVQGVVNNIPGIPNPSVYITGSDRDESTWYLKTFPQWKQNFIDPVVLATDDTKISVSATLVREWLFEDAFDAIEHLLPPETLHFLEKFKCTGSFYQLKSEHHFIKKYKSSWEVAPYPVTFTTVDAVVVQSGHVLVVKRGAEPGKGLWALPGGFLNQNEKLRDGAIRELVEETGIRLAEGKKAKEITTEILKGSIREKEVFDKPDRSSRGRTITTAFLFRLDDTKPLPKVKGMDDAADAFWISINDALECTENWFEDHHAIIETMIAYKDI